MAPFYKMEFPPERKFRYSPGTVHEDKPCSTDEMNIQKLPQTIQPKQNPFDAPEFEAIQERIQDSFATKLK